MTFKHKKINGAKYLEVTNKEGEPIVFLSYPEHWVIDNPMEVTNVRNNN